MALKQFLAAAVLTAASADGTMPVAANPRMLLQPVERPAYLAKPPEGAAQDRFIPFHDRPWYLQAIENLAIGAAANTERKQSDGRPRTPTTP